jgi:hypothetical protein
VNSDSFLDKAARERREEQIKLVQKDHTYRYNGDIIPVVRVNVSNKSDFLHVQACYPRNEVISPKVEEVAEPVDIGIMLQKHGL